MTSKHHSQHCANGITLALVRFQIPPPDNMGHLNPLFKVATHVKSETDEQPASSWGKNISP